MVHDLLSLSFSKLYVNFTKCLASSNRYQHNYSALLQYVIVLVALRAESLNINQFIIALKIEIHVAYCEAD